MNRALPARIVCALAAIWFGWVIAHAFVFDPSWRVHLLDVSIVGLPSWCDAWWRDGRAVFGAAAIGLASWQIGRRLARVVMPPAEDPMLRAQFALALGVVALSELLLLLALIGLYRPLPIGVLLIVAVVSRPTGLASDARRLTSASRRALRRGVARTELVWAVPAVTACLFALVAALAPETEYDALSYHLWLPAQWLAAGRLVDIVQEYPSLYPGTWELLNGAAMVAGGPVAAKLLQFGCAPLTAAAACVVARDVSPRTSRWLVTALIVTAPTLLWEASTAYVDLALAWFVTLAVVAGLRYYRTGGRRWLVVCALMTGAGMGIKHLGLIVLALLAGAVFVRDTRKGSVRRAGTAVAVLTIVALAIAAPWYIRAFAESGNPVFPEMYGLFGARPETRWSDDTEAFLEQFKAHFGMGRDAAALVALPWNITTHGARFGGTLGPLFLMLVPFGFVQRGRTPLFVLAAAAAAYTAVWASPLGSFQLRFLLPVLPCMAVIAAAGGGLLIDGARRAIGSNAAAVFTTAIALLLLANLPPFMDWHDTERHEWDGWLTHVVRRVPASVVVGGESTDTYLARTVPTYRAWQDIERRTAPDARVLTFVGGDQLYSHRSRLWSDTAIAWPITWGAHTGDESRMLAAARQAGITHVLFDRRQLPAIASLAITSRETRAHFVVPFFDDGRIEVVQMVYPSSEKAPSARSDR